MAVLLDIRTANYGNYNLSGEPENGAKVAVLSCYLRGECSRVGLLQDFGYN